jgi:Ca2+/Na+ antiporter
VIASHQTEYQNLPPVDARTMANADVIAYNVSTFLCALFVLEFGADKFIDHTAVVALRTGIPQAVIGLLTAGAEWEEVSEFL